MNTIKITKELLIDLKREQHLTNKQIAKILNINNKIVNKLIKKYKIIYKERDYDFLKSLLLRELSLAKMAQICNCKRGEVVKRNLIKFNLIEDTKPKIKCYECGIESNTGGYYQNKYYCKKHYNHMYRHGKILERTIHDANEYIIKNKIVKMTLRDKNSNITGYTYFDEKYLNKITKYKWYCRKSKKASYAVTKGINPDSPISMQDVIFDNIDENFHTIKTYDHIDNNGLNNKEDNLRIVTTQQNAMNMSIKTTNSSGVVGVQAYKADAIPKWDASITYKYKPIYLGRDTSFDKMVKLRLKGECTYFKEYSNNYNPKTNHIELYYFSHDDNLYKYIELDLDGNILTFKKL